MTGSSDFSSWTGPHYPNASSAAQPVDTKLPCSQGCLFNVVDDPTEHVDQASAHPQIVANMTARLNVLRQGIWNNHDVGVDVCPPGINMPCACWVALNRNRGFLGPYQY